MIPINDVLPIVFHPLRCPKQMIISLDIKRDAIAALLCLLALFSVEQDVFGISSEFNPDRQDVWAVAFSPDDRYVVATADGYGYLVVWHTESCVLYSLLNPLPINANFGGNDVIGIAWNLAKSAEFATAMRDGSIRQYEFSLAGKEKVSEKATFIGVNPAIHPYTPGMRTVAFSPDGTLLAAAGHGPFIYVWRTSESSKPLHVLDANAYAINSISFGKDNSTLISAEMMEATHGTIRVWDLAQEKEVRAIKTPGPVMNAAVSPNKNYVAVNVALSIRLDHPQENETVLYDFTTGNEIRRFRIDASVWSLAFSPDGNFRPRELSTPEPRATIAFVFSTLSGSKKLGRRAFPSHT